MKKFCFVLLSILFLVSCERKENVEIQIFPEEDASQFVLVTDVVPDAILEIRYYRDCREMLKTFPTN